MKYKKSSVMPAAATAKKTDTKPAAPAKAAAPTPAAKKAEPATKKAATTPAASKAAPAPAVAPVAAAATTATEQPAASAVGDNLISDLLEKFTALNTQIKTMQSALKLIAKEFDKQKKVIDKVQKKKEKAKKSPSGFAKPCKISDELCEFIGIPKGTEQSRTDITRFINAYVKQHNLNNPQNRREFFPDKKLKAILNVKDGEKVTYFVLQRLIAHHFPPSMSKLAAAAKTQ